MSNDRQGISRRAAIGRIVGGVTTLSAVSTEALALTGEEAISPANGKKPAPAGYKKNPSVTTRTSGDIRLAVQSLVAGGQTATAYRETGGTLFLSVAHTFPGTDAEAKARGTVQGAVDFDALVASHRAWWHAYYRKSFVSIPDQRRQSFHWIQLYKIASGTRAGGPVMATSGPWLEPTPWPAAWWNLNVQLEYWLIHGSNHLELDAITTTLKNNQQQLINNVPSAYRSDSSAVGRASDMFCVRSVGTPGNDTEVGNLTWALHNVWLTYRHSMDDNLLRDTLFPLLRRAVNYYLHFLTTDGNGRMHLPGAFLVSAARTGGVTRFVRVRSLAGEPLRLRPGIAGPLTVVGDDGTPAVWRDRGAGVLEIDLARDREVLVKAADSNPDLVIAPVAASTPGAAWGLP